VALLSRTAAQVLVLTMGTGCEAYRPAPAPVPTGSLVRVRFDQPRTLIVARRRSPGDSVRVFAVTEVEGRVRAARGDTLEVELQGVAPGAPAGTRGGRTHINPPYRHPVEVLRANPGGTLAVVGAFTAGLIAVMMAGLASGIN
jgi:hypothetical protein